MAHGFDGQNKRNRPKSATPTHAEHHQYHSPQKSMQNLPPKEKEKQLTNLVRRIRQKSAKGTKETWSAARLSELLDG